MRDLIGVGVSNPVHASLVAEAIHTVILDLQKQDLTVRSLGIVVPTAFEEFQRRHLLYQLRLRNISAGLIDASIAALRAISSKSQVGTQEEETVAVVIADDSALEIALARIGQDRGTLLGTEICTGLSGRSLNHFLLKEALDSLTRGSSPGSVRMGWDALDGLLDRLSSSHSRLARMPEIRFPLHHRHLKDMIVTLGQKNIQDFFRLHTTDLVQAVESLRKEMQANQVTIVRVILLGEFGEFSEFTQHIEKLLGPVEVLPITKLADGATMAAGEPPTEYPVQNSPQLVPLSQFLKKHAQPLALPVSELSEADLERQIANFFDALELAGANTPKPLLEQAAMAITRRSEEWLHRLRLQSSAITAPDTPPLGPDLTGAGRHVGKDASPRERPSSELTLATPSAHSRKSQRYMEEAERLLAAGKVLEAVALSHQAHQSAPDDHATLLAMLEVHRRGAAALAGPENFEAAILQLNCALQHRRQDKQTQEALAARYIEQARHLRNHGRLDEAREYLDKALDYVEDDAEVLTLLDQLDAGQAK
ncbi:MAG: hypothetical protein ABSD76_11545 [Terriglobales bacterium]